MPSRCGTTATDAAGANGSVQIRSVIPARLRAFVDQSGSTVRSIIQQQPPHLGQHRFQAGRWTPVHDGEEEFLVGEVDDVAFGRAVQDGADGAGAGDEALIQRRAMVVLTNVSNIAVPLGAEAVRRSGRTRRVVAGHLHVLPLHGVLVRSTVRWGADSTRLCVDEADLAGKVDLDGDARVCGGLCDGQDDAPRFDAPPQVAAGERGQVGVHVESTVARSRRAHVHPGEADQPRTGRATEATGSCR